MDTLRLINSISLALAQEGFKRRSVSLPHLVFMSLLQGCGALCVPGVAVTSVKLRLADTEVEVAQSLDGQIQFIASS